MRETLRLAALGLAALLGSLPGAVAHAHDPQGPETGYGAVAKLKLKEPESASTSHLHPDDLASVPLRSAEDALRLVPGLTLVQHGSEGKGYQYFLRGFDAVHGMDLELTVDGVPINELSNVHAQGYLDVGFVIPELIQEVQVMKGPFGLDQGAFAMAGTARYRLGVSEETRGLRASYTAGTTLRQRLFLSYSPKSGDGSQFVGAELLNDPGFGQARHARRVSALGRVRLFDSQRLGRLSLLLSGYAADFGLPGLVRPRDVAEGRLDFYDAYFDDGKGRSLRGLAALDYQLEHAGHRVRANLHAGYRDLSLFENFTGDLFDPEHGDFRDQRHRAWFYGASLSYDAPLTSGLVLRSGLGLRGDVIDQRELRTDSTRDFTEPRRGLDGSQVLAHALLGLVWRPVRAFELEVGGRGDLFHVNVQDEVAMRSRGRDTLLNLSPRALASLRVNPQLKLFAAYGRGFRPPEARAFTGFRPGMVGIGEEGAEPGAPRFTRSHAVELGARVRPYPTLAVNASGFATLIARESVFDHVSGLNLELNGTRRLGGELVISYAPLEWLRLSADATAVNARFIESHRPVPFAPWLTAGARAVLTHPSGVRAGLRFLTVAPRDLPHGARGQALYLLDATVGYRRHWWSLDAAVENLLARKLREGEYHYASHWYPDEPRSQIPTLQYAAGPPINARLTFSVLF